MKNRFVLSIDIGTLSKVNQPTNQTVRTFDNNNNNKRRNMATNHTKRQVVNFTYIMFSTSSFHCLLRQNISGTEQNSCCNALSHHWSSEQTRTEREKKENLECITFLEKEPEAVTWRRRTYLYARRRWAITVVKITKLTLSTLSFPIVER